MIRRLLIGWVTLMAVAASAQAAEPMPASPAPSTPPAPSAMPAMPDPQPEHAWLHRFVGEWDADVEMMMPGEPVTTSKGSAIVRPIGGFWVLAENKGTMMGKPFTGLLLLGYDVQKKQYAGVWVDSMSSRAWNYEGQVTGEILTLTTEGPCPAAGGKIMKMKESFEFKSKDHKVFTSQVQGEDGKWMTMMRINYRRTK